MKKYFKHYLKKNLSCLLVIILLFMIAYVIPLSTQNYERWNNPIKSTDANVYTPELYFAGLFSVLCILCVFVPIFIFSDKMNKRSVDLYYSLPLSRRKISAVHFLVGLLLIFSSYTAAFIMGFIVVAASIQRLHLIYYLALYFASLLPAFAIYASASFLYTRANTWFDGFICLCGAYCILALATLSLKANLSAYLPEGVVPYAFFPFAGIDYIASQFDNAIKMGTIGLGPDATVYAQNKQICILTGGAIWTLAGIAMAIAFIFLEPRFRAENCGQISESPFCYKVQIPIYTFLFASVVDVSDLLSVCALFFAVFIACAVYRRSFKSNLKFEILLLFCLFMGILFGGIPLLA